MIPKEIRHKVYKRMKELHLSRMHVGLCVCLQVAHEEIVPDVDFVLFVEPRTMYPELHAFKPEYPAFFWWDLDDDESRTKAAEKCIEQTK